MTAIAHSPTMVRRAVRCLLLVALATVGMTNVAGRAPRPPERPAKGVQVTGTCRDEAGQPLAGVNIVLYREDYKAKARAKLGTLETGADGRFNFPDAPDPSADRGLALVITKSGYGSMIRLLFVGSLQHPLEIKLRAAGTLQGRVTDEAGEPVAGARLWYQSLLTGPLDNVSSSVTDSDGKYAIADVGRWTHDDARPKLIGGGGRLVAVYFDVRHPDFAHERPNFDRIPTTVNVILQRGGVIEGKVTDQLTGKPAAGVAVALQGINRLPMWSQVWTDADGKYQIRCLKAGQYNLWADADDRACAAIDSLTVTTGKTLANQDLTLVEGGWIEGRVVDATTGDSVIGTPDRPLYVGCYGPGRPKSGPACQSARVDDKGQFRLRVAPGRNYPYIMTPDVWARMEGRAHVEAGIEVKTRETTKVVFRVAPAMPR